MSLQDSDSNELPERTAVVKYRQEQLANRGIEAALLERDASRAIRFRSLPDTELRLPSLTIRLWREIFLRRTNETNASECAGPIRLVVNDRILCLDASSVTRSDPPLERKPERSRARLDQAIYS